MHKPTQMTALTYSTLFMSLGKQWDGSKLNFSPTLYYGVLFLVVPVDASLAIDAVSLP